MHLSWEEQVMHLGVIWEHAGEPWGGVQGRAEVNWEGPWQSWLPSGKQ